MRPIVPLLVAASVAFLPPVLGTSPLDDDADSGLDAGDQPVLAVPVRPGAHAGRLSGIYDTDDYYAFQAHVGDVVRFSLSSQGFVFIDLVWAPTGECRQFCDTYGFYGPGDAGTLLITETGTWYLQVWRSLVGLDTVDYSFSFELQPSWSSVVSSSASRTKIVEFRWDEPSHVVGLGRIAAPSDDGDAFFGFVFAEFWTRGASGYTWIGLIGPGLNRHTEVTPSSLPSVDVPKFLTTGARSGWALTGIEFDAGGPGWIRVTTFTSGGPSIAYAISERPFEHAEAEGDDLVQWRESTSSSEPHVVAPVLAVSGDRDYKLDVRGRFLGFFAGDDGAARVTDPEGNDVQLSRGMAVFVGPREGTWMFHLDPAVTVGLAGRIYLEGVFVPDLELAPSGWLSPSRAGGVEIDD